MKENISQRVYCPNCDYRLEIEEHVGTYAITDNGQAFTACPNCLMPLTVEDGKLKEDLRP